MYEKKQKNSSIRFFPQNNFILIVKLSSKEFDAKRMISNF